MVDAGILSLVQTVAARKLRLYGGFTSQDVEDVASEAMLVLVERLQAGRDGGAEAVTDIEAYAATVTYNCCAHLIRRRHPERARLKARIRYLLASDPRFAIREDVGVGPVGGLSTWGDRAYAPEPERALDALVEAPDRVFATRGARTADTPSQLATVLREIFAVTRGPVALDRLTEAAGRICNIDLRVNVRPADDDAAATGDLEARIDERRLVERLWREVRELPLRQRIALLLNLRDARGAGLLWLLPVLGLATIRQIAAVLEIPASEMAALWGRLPLDDHDIAARLECTRQQVINLRMAGRKRLATRLRSVRASGHNRPERRGNLSDVSASMEHET
jgi:DNA-directed RNA polymerase specialized sigma24 family protein